MYDAICDRKSGTSNTKDNQVIAVSLKSILGKIAVLEDSIIKATKDRRSVVASSWIVCLSV